MDVKGMKVLVLGAGISGVAVAKVLVGLGASVTVSDQKDDHQLQRVAQELQPYGIELCGGPQDEHLLAGKTLLVISPGISIYIPLVEQAQNAGVEVISEVELAYRLCPAPMVAVTGTNGKTTTTTLVGEMLKNAGKKVVVGGNIGTALSAEVLDATAEHTVVAEISSFQLEGAVDFKPHISAILNITPDHIDRHRGFANYRAMKERVFSNQDEHDFLILNADDPQLRTMAEEAKSRVLLFSLIQEPQQGAFARDGFLVLKYGGMQQVVCRLSDISMRGAHNIQNAMAACLMSLLCGVSVAVMGHTLKTFKGVEHRIEYVDIIAGVDYYNDSKATNPESAIVAVGAFDSGVLLIAGGRDKQTDLMELMKLVQQRAVHLILLGEAADRFEQAARQAGMTDIHCVQDMAGAVQLARQLAQPGQHVLLSPACSSYDQFENYEQRGCAFKNFVQQLGRD